MIQLSKLIKSRDEWKAKAVLKAYEARELRKTRKHHKIIMARQKEEISRLTLLANQDNKKNSSI